MSPIVDVLIVDDEPDWVARLKKLVGDEFTVEEAAFEEAALECIRKRFYYCALLDKSLIPSKGNDEGGMRILAELGMLNEGTKGLIVTVHGDIESTKAAILDGKAVDYIQKQLLITADQRKKAQDKIRETIIVAKKDYAKRYGSGIAQLTADFTDPKSKSIWETNVIGSVGKEGGHQALAQFLDQLLEAVPPLIPYKPGEPTKIDRASATVEGKYWSKGLGESVLIKFGRTAEIEAMWQSLAPEVVIRRVSHTPYSGFIAKAGLQFEDLPSRT